MRRLIVLPFVLGASLASAQPRSLTQLPSSNGHTAVLVDLEAAKLTHFREHLFATEEPLLDQSGNEVWIGNQPQVVRSRDLLYDAYFGLRSGGSQRWLQGIPILEEASGYAAREAGAEGGTGILTWQQNVDGLELTSYAFAPMTLPHAGFVFAIRVRNMATTEAQDVSVFSLHNFHLGFGRPGVMVDLGETGETVVVDAANGRTDLIERAFAGVVVTRSLGTASRASAWHLGSPPSENGWARVNAGGTQDLPSASGTLPTADGYAHAFQFDLGTIAAGEERWAGIVAAHHGDPFAHQTVQSWLDTFVAQRGAQAVVEAEREGWRTFQSGIEVPAGASDEEETLVRQSAVMLAMAQVREETAFLREHLSTDGEPRYTRFSAADGGAPSLPGTVRHRGQGAVLASLPPGEWTYAWIRDGAYAVAAMSHLRMDARAEEGLRFYLNAEAGRFEKWQELAGYGLPPYQITLTRYHGFGVEETDFNDFGPNLEFDGFGLFLWALREYERATGDTALAEETWDTVSRRIADPLVALVDPATGLIRKDSSIWETHWNGRQRSWTYTNITAVRGLCDAADIAERLGDAARAATYRATAEGIREAIATHLTDSRRALASNLEELGAGTGYWDAAVLDALALGLFRPDGAIARATLDAMEENLRVSAGPGWARNDDRFDHAGGTDLSPWGGEYDSAEWVITDLRGAIALRRANRNARADQILDWVRTQSLKNAGAVAETYDESSGVYKFNAPMIGFGAGAWVLALQQRASGDQNPACGAWYNETDLPSDGGTPADGGAPSTDAGHVDVPRDPMAEGCGCGAGTSAVSLVAFLGLAGALRERRMHAAVRRRA